MNTITLDFDWKFDLPSVALFQFQIDLAKLGDESGDMSEYPSFYIDLSSGEILGVPSEIACGDGYRYVDGSSWLVASDGWWIGYNESLDERIVNLPDEKMTNELFEIFEWTKANNFNKIVDGVCEFARKHNLRKHTCEGLFDKYINSYEVPWL